MRGLNQIYTVNYETVKTLISGTILMVCLHYLIRYEQIREHGDIRSLEVPLEKDFQPLGMTENEILPETGPCRIPRIIHQTWKNTDVPSKFINWIKTWTRNHPDWEYWLWTDSSARDLIKTRHPYLLDTYDNYNENIRRADALRYVILYEFGGVYADMDVENFKSLDPMLRKYSCFVGQEPYEHPILDGNFETLVINALMASRPKHPFMKMLMDNLPNFEHMWHVLDSTGPHFVTNIYKQYHKLNPLPPTHDKGVYVAPAEYFFPTIDPAKYFWFRNQCSKYKKLSERQQKACKTLKLLGIKRKPSTKAFTVHHWAHTYFDFRLSLKAPVNIYKVVPHAKIFDSLTSAVP